MAEGVNVLKKVYVGNRVHFRHVDGLLYPGRVVKVGRLNHTQVEFKLKSFLSCKNGHNLHLIEPDSKLVRQYSYQF